MHESHNAHAQLIDENVSQNHNLTLKFDYKNLNKLSTARKFLDFVRYFMMPQANNFINILDQGLEQRICTSTVLNLTAQPKNILKVELPKVTITYKL